MQIILSYANRVKEILGLTTSLAGVKFLFSDKEIPINIDKLSGHRYCHA